MLNTDPTSAYVLTWKKPSTNWLKCDVDGAIFMIEGKFGIGICFRDSLSSSVQTYTMIFPFIVTAAECEATTMKHALALALSNGFERVIYLKVTVNSSLLNSNANYNIAYVRRQVNRVAHNLDRVSLFQSSSGVHHYYPPNYISSTILNEMQ
ncbi:uncharacterized protein LOC123896382 [Trifolium pratense]|uniref:uncharacterized protein LOC123896382 n=1 Tax=Trifolium pratense TaxID=57577 RepID=UPI001E692515|nr:uncharacterized protein LOC123896382 [Trifolium pratense]